MVRCGRGRGWKGGRGGAISEIGSWVGLTWSHSRQHWQRVVGERHAGGPRLGGQGAEIEFPQLLMRTRRRESWQKRDQQKEKKMAEQRRGFNQTWLLILTLTLLKNTGKNNDQTSY